MAETVVLPCYGDTGFITRQYDWNATECLGYFLIHLGTLFLYALVTLSVYYQQMNMNTRDSHVHSRIAN